MRKTLVALCVLVMAGSAAMVSAQKEEWFSPDTCTWSPGGPVSIAPGAVQLFTSSFTGCGGVSVSISPANGTAGFSAGSDCTLTSTTTRSNGTFKVRGCNEGAVTVTVGSQNISVTVEIP